jgi:hypothetical protein
MEGVQMNEIAIRFGHEKDAPALQRLAALEDRRLPAGPLVVAEVDGELVAALSVEDGEAVADPFRHTAQVVSLLRLRVEQLSQTARRRPWGGHRRIVLADA